MDTATVESPKTPRLTPALVLYFWPHVRPDLGRLVLSFIGLGVQAAFSVLVTMIPAILERHWSASSRNFLYLAVGGILGLNMLVLVVQSAVNWTMTNITENVVRRVKLAIFKKVGSLPSEEMNFQVVGKFAQRTTGDVMRLGGLVSPGLTQAAFSALQLIFMLGALFWLDWRFALALPFVIALIWVIVRKINEKVRFWARKDQLEHERVLTQFIESIGGVRDLVACGRFENAAVRYDGELAKKQRFVVLSAWWNNLAGMVPTAMFSFMIFGYYLWRIARTDFAVGNAEVGTMLTFAGNLLMAQGLVLSVFKLWTESEMSAPSLYELKRLLESPEVPDPESEAAIPSGEVVFDGVTFSYGMSSAISGSRRLRASSRRSNAPGKPSQDGTAIHPHANGAKASAPAA
jgi:ABC-type multidrug transport system fused ATPase/permease subunit